MRTTPITMPIMAPSLVLGLLWLELAAAAPAAAPTLMEARVRRVGREGILENVVFLYREGKNALGADCVYASRSRGEVGGDKCVDELIVLDQARSQSESPEGKENHKLN